MEQDSFEDFIKLNRNNKKTNDKQGEIKNILVTAQRKKECEDRAIEIVQLLMEGTIRPGVFLKSISYLNSSYYQDVVEERALTNICGYPLCGKTIRPFELKKYSISTKTNKVYDLDEHRYFCSIFCINASNHIKEQIDDSPLWLRNFLDTPTYNLLPKDKGHTHSGIDIKLKKVVKNNDFTPVSMFTQNSLEDFEHQQRGSETKFELDSLVEKKDTDLRSKSLEAVEEETIENLMNDLEVNEPKNDSQSERLTFKNEATNFESKYNMRRIEEEKETGSNCSKNERLEHDQEYHKSLNSKLNSSKSNDLLKSPDLRNLKLVNDKIKTKMMKPAIKLIDPLPLKNSVSNKNTSKSKLKDHSLLELKLTLKNPVGVKNQLETTFKSWITLNTLIYVHGENKIREIFDENKLSQYFNKLKIADAEVAQQKKYMEICKKLQLQELLDEQWDKASTEILLKPIPDYKKLKEEIKEADVKVKTFYGGVLYEKEDSNFPVGEIKENEENDEAVAVLPLVDVNSQNALRRRVLLNSLTKGVKIFTDVINNVDLTSDLQDLVKTFKLTADNIVFKPILWNYLGFVCLKILTLKDADLRKRFEEEDAKELENLVLKQLNSDVISSCLEMIKDVDSFIENYISSTDT